MALVPRGISSWNTWRILAVASLLSIYHLTLRKQPTYVAILINWKWKHMRLIGSAEKEGNIQLDLVPGLEEMKGSTQWVVQYIQNKRQRKHFSWLKFLDLDVMIMVKDVGCGDWTVATKEQNGYLAICYFYPSYSNSCIRLKCFFISIRNMLWFTLTDVLYMTSLHTCICNRAVIWWFNSTVMHHSHTKVFLIFLFIVYEMISLSI